MWHTLFAYTRWNDGELDTLTGWKSKTRVTMTQLEGWTTDNNTVNRESLNFDLRESLKVGIRIFYMVSTILYVVKV
jgi:hypothetical protein